MSQTLGEYWADTVTYLGAVQPQPEAMFYLGALAALRLVKCGERPDVLVAEIDARCTIEEAR